MDYPDNPLIAADQLKSSNVQKRRAKEIVDEILRKINDELKEARNAGRQSVMTDVPIVFDIPNMSNKESQRLVWATILRILAEKGFRAWINPTNDRCIFKITWLSSEDSQDIDNQMRLIATRTKKF